MHAVMLMTGAPDSQLRLSSRLLLVAQSIRLR
jgi:hypothetical protein